MTDACQASAGGGRFYAETFDFIDCMSHTMGSAGFDAMARSGSSAALITSGLLTLAVALLGYRLLLGERTTLSDIVGLAAKIGFVIAVTNSWSAYHTLFYQVALSTPEELVEQIAGGAPTPRSELAERLQQIDGAIAALPARSRAASVTAADAANIPVGSPLTPPVPTSPKISGEGLVDPSSIAQTAERGRLLLMLTALGSFCATRLLAGLLLAIGPLFVACLVLTGSRALFIGWLRVLAGATLGAFAATMLLWIETSALAPVVRGLSAATENGSTIGFDLLPLTAILGIMALAVFASTIGFACVPLTLRWPEARINADFAGSGQNWQRGDADGIPTLKAFAGTHHPPATPGVSSILSAVERQAARDRSRGERSLISTGTSIEAALPAEASIQTGQAERSTNRRRIGSRTSAAAGRRDTR